MGLVRRLRLDLQDKSASYEAFHAHDEIVTVAIFAPDTARRLFANTLDAPASGHVSLCLLLFICVKGQHWKQLQKFLTIVLCHVSLPFVKRWPLESADQAKVHRLLTWTPPTGCSHDCSERRVSSRNRQTHTCWPVRSGLQADIDLEKFILEIPSRGLPFWQACQCDDLIHDPHDNIRFMQGNGYAGKRIRTGGSVSWLWRRHQGF